MTADGSSRNFCELKVQKNSVDLHEPSQLRGVHERRRPRNVGASSRCRPGQGARRRSVRKPLRLASFRCPSAVKLFLTVRPLR